MGPKSSSDDVLRAVQAERTAWQAVAQRLPGSPGHDPLLWAHWMDAARSLIQIQ